MRKLLFTLFITFSITLAKAQIIINEIMQSNVDCVMDDTNEFPDSWVELYNTDIKAIDIREYKIGTTSNPSEAWALPETSISAKGHALVYCDKGANKMHTSFRLESGKGACVYLFKKDVLVDSVVNLNKQPAPNISYGRQTSGASLWGYQHTPTPAKANCGTICSDILGDPVFSIEGRVFTSKTNISLKISLPENTPDGTEIRISYNNAEPTENSPLYTGPISISSTRVIRAKLFNKKYLSPRSTTHSYIFLDRDMTLPVISINTNNEYLNDSKIGIYVSGSYNSNKKNYEYNWRRPINLEFFDEANTESALNQLCETRIAGAASRGCMFKSLAIYANKRFGTKRFKYEFFPDQRPEQTNYKSLVLRNAGNDFDYLYMRDAIIQRTMAEHVDLDWQAWRPSIVYINGVYKGILNIRERANEDNIFSNYDELEEVDVFENWTSLKQGTPDNLNAFKAFYNEHDHTYDEYSKWMDIEEFINLMAMNCYFNNIDFPANNIVMWRPRTEEGRWRFIAKDTDYTMGLYNQCKYDYKYIDWLYNNDFDQNCKWGNTYDATRLFRRLMEDKDFKREFTDRMAVYMGDFLNYEHIWKEVWEPMYNIIKTEYPKHRELINRWWPNYTDEINIAKNWLISRTSFMYKHLASYYGLGTPTPLSINDKASESDLNDVNITMNGIPLTHGRFNGYYFASKQVTLHSEPNPDAMQQVIGWNIIQTGNFGRRESYVDGPECSFTVENNSNTSVKAIFGTYDDIPQVATSSSESATPEYYDIRGVRLTSPKKGITIMRGMNGTYKKIIK